MGKKSLTTGRGKDRFQRFHMSQSPPVAAKHERIHGKIFEAYEIDSPLEKTTTWIERKYVIALRFQAIGKFKLSSQTF